jgi:hypothetical protein
MAEVARHEAGSRGSGGLRHNGSRLDGDHEVRPMSNSVRSAWVLASLLAAAGCLSAQQQPVSASPPSSAISKSGPAMTMPASGLAKLDAFLQQAVLERRTDLLRVMVWLAEGDGAEARVRSVLAGRNRAVEKRLMDRRLLVTTIDTREIGELASSRDVERISLDAVVKSTSR